LLISGIQKGSKDGALNNFGPDSSDKGKAKANIGNGHNTDRHNADRHNTDRHNTDRHNTDRYNADRNLQDRDWTATGATGSWVSFKYIAGDISLNKGGKNIPLTEKVQYID